MINWVIFGHLGSYLLYNAIDTRKIAKNTFIFFLSEEICSPSSYVVNSRSKYYAYKTLWNLCYVDTFYCQTKAFLVFLFVYITRHHNDVKWHHMIHYFLLTSLAHYITLCQIKIRIRSLCGQLTCALFYQTNKHHVYDTTSRCRYVVSLHYKDQIQNLLWIYQIFLDWRWRNVYKMSVFVTQCYDIMKKVMAIISLSNVNDFKANMT